MAVVGGIVETIIGVAISVLFTEVVFPNDQKWPIVFLAVLQRWHVDHPDAPDGIAIVGYDDERATYLEHYFDSRGVARVYEMNFAKRSLEALARRAGLLAAGLCPALHRQLQR